MTGTPDSKDEWNEENKQDEIDLLEEKLKENESKFESTLMVRPKSEIYVVCCVGSVEIQMKI